MTGYEAIATGIYSTLSGGTALVTALGGTAIYHDLAPDVVPLPYVVFSLQAGGPENITPSDIQSHVFYIRAYATTNASAQALNGYIDALLHKKTITVTGYTNFWTAREADVIMEERLPSGAVVYSAGGMYRFRTDQ